MISDPKGSFFSLSCNSRSSTLPENIKLFHILRKNLPLYSQKNTGSPLKPENASLCSFWEQYTRLLQINQGCNPWVRLTLKYPKLLYLIQVKMRVGVCLYTAIA